MPGRTAISWATDTWNPTWGCRKISPGCAHCYIADTMPFRERGMRFERGEIPITLHPNRLEVPIRWTSPRMIFVNSLSDLFHDDIQVGFILQVYATMMAAPQHIYRVLTKRPERMRNLLNNTAFWANLRILLTSQGHHAAADSISGGGLPTPAHIWHGVTIENRAFVSRADLLRDTNTAVRFISAEPLLGPLLPMYTTSYDPYPRDMQTGDPGDMRERHYWHDGHDETDGGLSLRDIDEIIIGGESGPKARPVDENWMWDLVWRAHNPIQPIFDIEEQKPTAVHVKQMGTRWARAHGLPGKADMLPDFPERLQVREQPTAMRGWPQTPLTVYPSVDQLF